MDKAVCAGRADGLFVQTFSIKVAALQAGELGADQRGAVLEVLGAIYCPSPKVIVVSTDDLFVLMFFACGRTVTIGRVRQRTVKVKFGACELFYRP